jgi:hypothetical protein
MDLMRSEAMQLVQVIIPAESAHLTVSYLGDLGLVQFKDVRPPAPQIVHLIRLFHADEFDFVWGSRWSRTEFPCSRFRRWQLYDQDFLRLAALQIPRICCCNAQFVAV